MMLLLGSLALTGCSDTGLSALQKDVGDALPAIAVSPTRLDFLSVESGAAVTLPFTVASIGETALAVSSISLEGLGSFTLLDGAEGFDLLPGESRTIDVAFAPVEPGEQSGVVTVASDDPDHPEVTVDLLGDGRVPSLAITPDPWDFGALPLGCTDAVTLMLQNVGEIELEVDDWSYVGDGLTFSADLAPPFVLEPYEYVTAVVTYAPFTAGAVEGVLSVTSNDPRGTVTAFQSGEGIASESAVDTFVTPTDPPVDVLFAIDRSTSMDDDAVGLAAAFSTFIEQVGAVTGGWHIGVVTTDGGCFNGGVLDVTTPDLALVFAEAAIYGDDRDILYDEALFQIVDAALGETGAGGCNEGFLRDDALLHVIVVSDEPERSPEFASVWTWDWFLSRYQGYVTSPALLEVSGIVDVDGCNEGNDGYAEVIAATGGEALSICSGDWVDRLTRLATASLAYTWTFELSEAPVVASIVITVDGTEVPAGWLYDETLNAVVLDTLTPGSTVEVAYSISTGCP